MSYDKVGFRKNLSPAINDVNLNHMDDGIYNNDVAITTHTSNASIHVVKDGTLQTGLNADKVDGYQASATPTASTILPLNSSGKFPASVVTQGTGSGLDADTLDGQHSSYYYSSANKPYVVGTYTGDLNTSRFINLGFTPTSVSLFNARGSTIDSGNTFGGLAVTGANSYSYANGTSLAIEIVTNGFNVFYDNGTPKVKTNDNAGGVHRYIAHK